MLTKQLFPFRHMFGGYGLLNLDGCKENAGLWRHLEDEETRIILK
jgi:hypothetical protein